MTRNMKLNIVNHNFPLPEELILEILLRLPVTSLFRFKCVSKSWKTLISCPQFAKTHLQISTTKPSLTDQQLLFSVFSPHDEILSYSLKSLFENPLTSIKPVSFTVMMKHKHFVIDSCNGLLCIYHSFPSGRVRLCNPSTKFKSKKSPKCPSLDWILTHRGFGYDQVNDKYKVLLVVRNTNDYLTKLYTFGEDSWKTILNFPYTPTQRLGKFVSGTLNWIVDKGGVSSNQKAILSFDLEKETYGEVMLPQSDGDYICIDKLHVLSNCLCVCFLNKTHWVAWLMKEYGVVESWTKLMIIPHEKLVSKSLTESFFIDPLFISENGIVLIGKELSAQLVLYNLNNGRFDFTFTGGYLGQDNHIYRESLISPRW